MLNAKVLLTMHRENEGMKDGWRDLENGKRETWILMLLTPVALFILIHFTNIFFSDAINIKYKNII